jgi:hypothetical protein
VKSLAKKVRFELDIKGLNELMKSSEMQAALQSAGDAVARSSGKEYAARVHTASFVAIANVYPNSKEAAKDNYENNTLIKGIRGAGLSTKKGG